METVSHMEREASSAAGYGGANAMEKPCKALSSQIDFSTPDPLTRVMKQTESVKYCAHSMHTA